MKNLEILFLGTPSIAADILQDLIDAGYKIKAVITMPDKPKGRSARLIANDVKLCAEKNGISIFQTDDKMELVDLVNDILPDLTIVVAFGMIIPKVAIDIPRFGTLNLHYSLLPQYRGAAPYVDAILNSDKATGVSIIKMSEGLDEGDIITQEKVFISPEDTAGTLLNALNKVGSKLLVRTIPAWVEGKIVAKRQLGNPTFSKKIQNEDAKICWEKETATEIELKIRALSIWPVAYSTQRGRLIKLIKAAVSTNAYALAPGEIKIDNGQIFVGTKSGILSLQKIKIAGKNEVTAKDAINGKLIRDGEFLGSD